LLKATAGGRSREKKKKGDIQAEKLSLKRKEALSKTGGPEGFNFLGTTPFTRERKKKKRGKGEKKRKKKKKRKKNTLSPEGGPSGEEETRKKRGKEKSLQSMREGKPNSYYARKSPSRSRLLGTGMFGKT